MDKLSRIVETSLAYDQSEKVEQANSTAIFQNERIISLKKILQKRGNLSKTACKDVYFLVPLHRKSQNCVRVQTNYELFPAYFRLGLPTRVSIKLLNVLIFFLEKLNVCFVTLLDSILVMATSIEDLEIALKTHRL